MGNDNFIATFKEEALELLGTLETVLLELEDNPTDKELLSSLFRVMHTIKGSSAMFGLDHISKFSHEVESILAALRDGKLSVSRTLIDNTLIARDLILGMLENPVAGVGSLDSEHEAFLASFREQTGFQNIPDPALKNSGTVQGPDRNTNVNNPQKTWRIRFIPGKEAFRRGGNPLALIQEIKGLGETVCIPLFDNIPCLSELECEDCLVSWELYLTSTVSENEIRDVFVFVEDYSKIEIECLENLLDESLSSPKKLGEILIEKGRLEPEKLNRILKAQKRLGEILVEEKLVSPSEIKVALEEQKQLQKAQKNRISAMDMSTIRVKSEKLDQLMSLVGELVTVHAQILQTSTLIDGNDELVSIVEQFGRLTDELRSNTMSIRMVPIGTTFNSFKRLVRDLSSELGKSVELETEGEETELDKTIIEKLNDPLIHIIRNSLDHGIELPQTRTERGKRETGTIRLSAAQTGASVYITIEDDGNGLNKDAILKKAIAKGLVSPDDNLSEADIFRIIFAPGFSTKENVTAVSGRGVGMDVVNRQMELINGTVAIQSKEREYTKITLKIPLTLAIIDGLLVRIDSSYFVIPLSVVTGCLEFIQTNQKNGNSIVLFHDKQLPFINMRTFFDIPGERPHIEQIIVVAIKNIQIGILVDQVIGGNQTVIKPLGKLYKRATGVSSATILGDGSVALILDVEQIIENTGQAEK